MSDKRLKCRFCSYSVLKYRTRKDGIIVPGWGRLNYHIEIEHWNEAKTIMEKTETSFLGEANLYD